jgi:hypothetical protein
LIIQPIVEGHGEVAAVPILLRALQAVANCYQFQIGHPIRQKRSQLINESGLRKAVQLGKATPDCVAILVLLDADDDPPCLLGPQMLQWARSEANPIPCELILAHHEYEAWFLASVESLRGRCGISMNATSHPTPEGIRDAKGAIQDRMMHGAAYSPTAHQPSLTAGIELPKVHQACRSFRKFVKAFGEICRAAGANFPEWPPAEWSI